MLYDDEGFSTYDFANRLTQETQGEGNTYVYDQANRLVEVDGVSYLWDDNGNLLFDGEKFYSYDYANRLTSVNGAETNAGFAYNGLGVRLQQTVDGATMTYTLDLNTGLTQVLTDGETTYLYGLARLSQESDGYSEYYLGDALGSVRQLTEGSGALTYAASYTPYGETLASAGEGESVYGYTGESASQELVYLRARYYNPGLGAFLNRDPSRLEANPYLYAGADPINRTDPNGLLSTHGLEGPAAFTSCFAIHTGLPGAGLPIPSWISAQEAVDLCKTAFNQDAWASSWFTKAKTLPKTAHDLFGMFMFEWGGYDYLAFNGNEPLTIQLARSSLIHDVRKMFYAQKSGGDIGRTGKLPEYQFKLREFALSLAYDSWLSVHIGNISFPLTFVMGSFNYQVRTLGGGRVGFRIDNLMSIDSGTHIVNRFDPYSGSVEELIALRTNLRDKPLQEVINPKDVYGPISILRGRSRTETIGTVGGGNLYQTYIWTEQYDPCLAEYDYLEMHDIFLDVQRWVQWDTMTRDPENWPSVHLGK